MISPEEIKHQAIRLWNQVLVGYINGNRFLPIQIDRIGKVRPGDVHQQFEKIQNEIETLFRQSKNETGIGYIVKKSEYKFRRSGSHELPESIVIESLDDFLHVTGKKKEWVAFVRNYELLAGSIPALKEWSATNTSWLLKKEADWTSILLVCHYFLSTPRPDLYIRQLPVQIHTKFIEENAPLLQSLLDFLIPEHIRDNSQKRFAERFFLKFDEPLIRIRILDDMLQFQNNIKDLSIPLSSFRSLSLNCNRILIAENKMNFLTLPEVPGSVALWSGGGFNISYLKNIEWLKHEQIYYWGDIDEHGFQILHQLRSYYPGAESILMDLKTYTDFEKFAVSTPPASIGELSFLNANELEVLNMLRLNPEKNRLEQERISQEYSVRKIRSLY
jgi:hypothetical protein